MNEEGRGRRRAGWSRPLPLALALSIAASELAAQEVRWVGTVSYWRGSYIFDETTHTVSFSTGVGLSWDRLDFSASVPVLLQNSALVSLVGGGALPTGGEDNAIIAGRGSGETLGTQGKGKGGGDAQGTETDIVFRDEFSMAVGDPFFTAGGRLYGGNGFVRSVRLQLSSKAPLRSLESGVGTGEWDFGAGASVFTALGSTYAFADVAYWWYGDLPDLELVDGLGYGLGLSHSLFDARGSVMVSFITAEPPIATMARPATLGLGLSYMPSLGTSFSGGIAVGLSESSPDFSVYGGWSVRIR